MVKKTTDSSLYLPDHGIVSTPNERFTAIQKSYELARQVIVEGLTEQLLVRASNSWICSSDLFNRTTLPTSISIAKIGMEVWKQPTHVMGSTEVYVVESHDDIRQQQRCLLRHKFSNGFYYYRACLIEGECCDLHILVASAVEEYTDQSKTISLTLKTQLEDSMKLLVPQALDNVIQAQQLTVGIPPKVFVIKWKPQLVTYIHC